MEICGTYYAYDLYACTLTKGHDGNHIDAITAAPATLEWEKI